ncbi:MAG: DNA repair protein RecO [Nitrospinales bacterium]
MGLHKTQAIVLRSINLSKGDKLVTFLTEKYGKIKCAARAARRIKSRFGAALLPMSHIELIYFGKERQEIFRLNHCDIIQSFQTVREDLQKVYTGIYFNELVDSLIPEGDRGPEFFHFLRDALCVLRDQEDLKTLSRLFEIRIMALSGYAPRLDRCAVCQKKPDAEWVGFSYRNSGVICRDCAREARPEIRIRAGSLSYLRKLLTIDLKQSPRLKIPKSLESEIEAVTHRMISYYLKRELRSYPFIKKMAGM